MEGYIYKIVNNINNKIYIGKTAKSISFRYKEHLNCARRFAEGDISYGTRLYPAMVKYGVENFSIHVIEKVDLAEIDSREKYYIELFNSCDPTIGYNISPGGRGGALFKGHKHSTETKKLLSENNYWKIHSQSPEYVDKRFAKRRASRPYIQCLDTAEVYDNISILSEYLGTSPYHALRNHGKCKGKFYIYRDRNTTPLDLNECLIIKQQYEEDLHKRYKQGAMRAANDRKNWDAARIEAIREKRNNTLSNKTPEDKAREHANRSRGAKLSQKNKPEEQKRHKSEICRSNTLKQHANRSREYQLEINAKNSQNQKGKKIFKNILTGEIKVICPKDFTSYDFTIWKRCNRKGELCEEN